MTASVARDAPGRAAAAVEWLRAHVPAAAVVAAAGGAGLVLYLEGRGTSFFYDEWNVVQFRREGGIGAFLEPHNGHLIALPVAAYRVLFALVGLRHYEPYRLTAIVLHLVCCALFFVLARRRIDVRVAAAATVLLLFLGSAWQVLLWPFQIAYLGSIAVGLGAILLLERGGTRRDAAASALLVVSWACSGLGIPFLLGAAVAVAWTPSRARRAWVVAVPAVLYALWYAGYGESDASLANVRYVPAYLADSLAATLGGITGLGLEWGRPLAVAAVVLALPRLLRPDAVTQRLAVAATVLLSFWTLTALTRGPLGEPGASRYLYPGAVLLLLVAIELAPRRAFARGTVAVLVAFAAAAVVANLGVLRDGAAGLRDNTRFVTAELAALELERATVAPDYRPDPQRAPTLVAGPYFAAVNALGSPAARPDALAGASPEVRAAVDRVFAEAGLGVEHGRTDATGAAPHVDAADAPTSVAGACVRARGGAVEITTKRPVVVLGRRGTSVDVAVRRLGDDFGDPVATLAGESAALTVGRDGLGVPWRLRLSGSGPFSVCGTGP